jgi:hypothetical protein
MTKTESFGIVWWDDLNKGRQYSCRGIGKQYADFYKNWVPKSSYRSVGEDWPWDFFVFDDPKDHDRLIADYPDDVWRDDYDD